MYLIIEGMKNTKKKRYVSTKTYIVLAVLALLAGSFIVAFFGITHFYKRRLKTELLDSLQSRTVLLAQTLSFYDMDLNTSDTTISTDIDEMASFIQGRIMVVSRDYKILKDTYVLKQDDYLISPDVMAVMEQREASVSRIRGNYAEIIYPIQDDDQVIGVIISTADVISSNQRFYYLYNEIFIVFLLLFLLDIGVAVLIGVRSMRGINAVNEQLYHMTLGNLQDKMEERGFKESRYLARNYNDLLDKFSDADQSRNEFVSNVSHELKTPIASMKVLAESLTQNEGAGVEDYREFMTDIISEIDRETKIINDLLTLVKTDNRETGMNFAETNMNQMLDSVIHTVEPLAKLRNIEISFENFRDVTADVDEVKLNLAISNLVENAVKYNVENGWIHVSLNADHKFFYIKVADSGVGIPDDAKEKVFERFYRVDKARSRDTGGTGLGLSITRGIINGHGGTIKVYSESGKGTTFSVKIPLRQEKVEAEELETAKVNFRGAGVSGKGKKRGKSLLKARNMEVSKSASKMIEAAKSDTKVDSSKGQTGELKAKADAKSGSKSDSKKGQTGELKTKSVPKKGQAEELTSAKEVERTLEEVAAAVADEARKADEE